MITFILFYSLVALFIFVTLFRLRMQCLACNMFHEYVYSALVAIFWIPAFAIAIVIAIIICLIINYNNVWLRIIDGKD